MAVRAGDIVLRMGAFIPGVPAEAGIGMAGAAQFCVLIHRHIIVRVIFRNGVMTGFTGDAVGLPGAG